MTQPSRPVSLTGIKPTGEPHLGNYIGAIRPALDRVTTAESLYFIADHHALTTVRDPAEMRHFTRSVAATWLAAGLDPQQTTFYRQSDVPQIFELAWVLSCVTPKGLMNRAHAYKAARDRNEAAGEHPDHHVSMGLYNYPVLMAADILIMDATVVPVGKDQVQHVEYTADIAQAFNAVYGEVLVVPEPEVPAADAGRTLPGLDGRKMSKSYGNTIPLFAPPSRLRKLVRSIVTDSTPVDAPKDPDASAPFQILEQFAPSEAVAATRARLEAGGMGWGDLKNELADVLEERLGPLRGRYEGLMAPDSELDAVLGAGGDRARARARGVLDRVRGAVGM